jgi:Fuc2NAc and GlcNAc transferase
VSAAALVAFLATFPIRRYARALGLLDLPGERSSHRVVTPRGGGLAIIAAAFVALALFDTRGDVGAAWMLFACAASIGALGLLDDLYGLHPLLRLAAHIAAGCVVVARFGPISSVPFPTVHPSVWASLELAPGFDWVVSLVWIAAVVNFFNFMDGIDGLASAQVIASCIGVFVAAWSADAQLLAVCVGGACLGFLFHNAPPARIFMGDSGSGFLGFVLATLPFPAPSGLQSHALLAVAIGLSLFLLDPAYTLARRAAEGKNILKAHREHLYQQLVAPDEPAGRVTSAYALTALALALVGAAGYQNPDWLWIGLIAGCAAIGVVWFFAERRPR